MLSYFFIFFKEKIYIFIKEYLKFLYINIKEDFFIFINFIKKLFIKK